MINSELLFVNRTTSKAFALEVVLCFLSFIEFCSSHKSKSASYGMVSVDYKLSGYYRQELTFVEGFSDYGVRLNDFSFKYIKDKNVLAHTRGFAEITVGAIILLYKEVVHGI